jgi:hypothetical protein
LPPVLCSGKSRLGTHCVALFGSILAPIPARARLGFGSVRHSASVQDDLPCSAAVCDSFFPVRSFHHNSFWRRIVQRCWISCCRPSPARRNTRGRFPAGRPRQADSISWSALVPRQLHQSGPVFVCRFRYCCSVLLSRVRAGLSHQDSVRSRATQHLFLSSAWRFDFPVRL